MGRMFVFAVVGTLITPGIGSWRRTRKRPWRSRVVSSAQKSGRRRAKLGSVPAR